MSKSVVAVFVITLLCGCAGILSAARIVLSVVDQECAWRAPSTDTKWVKHFCRIADAAEPALEELLASKASAQRAGVLRLPTDGGAE